MPRFYTAYLGPTLAQKFEELGGQTAEQRVQLEEELDLARIMTARCLALAKPVLEGAPGVTAELAQLALSAMGECLDRVTRIATQQHNLSKKSGDTMSLTLVPMLVQQICLKLYKVCGDEHIEIAKRFEAEVRDSVQIPKPQAEGIDRGVLRILHAGAEDLTEAMDLVTSPPDTETADCLSKEVHCSTGWQEEWENRNSQTEVGEGSSGEKAVG